MLAWFYLKRWIGEALINLGQQLVRSTREDFIRVTRPQTRNRYNW